MNPFEIVDSFLRRHPRLFLLCILALAMIATVCLRVIGAQHSTIVYEGF